MNNKIDDSTILIFNSITSFISDLYIEFGSKNKNITLYHRLLEKTGIVHTNPILKHIDCFRNFFIKNKEAMETKDHTKFVENKISYSDRVYIDLKNIFENSDSECSLIIWKHLLTIWGLIDPESQAKNYLKELSSCESKESDFLNKIIDKVEKNVDPSKMNTSNPMEMVSGLMQSGVFNDLISGMQGGLSDGSLDINKLMGSVQGMISKLSPDGQIPPEISGMMNMMGPMLNNFDKSKK
jgi:hypothetical protein